MSAAMGAWERFVSAGARKLFHDVDELVAGVVKGRSKDDE